MKKDTRSFCPTIKSLFFLATVGFTTTSIPDLKPLLRLAAQSLKSLLLVLAILVGTSHAQPQAPIIGSFGGNGLLVCTNLQPGSTASVEWASSLLGPWTNSWAGLDAVTVDSNGALRVSVPMFYRVRGVVPAPPGMVLIPAGAFTMGNCMDSGEGWTTELPLHINQLGAFYMDRTEVTKTLWDDVYQWALTHGYSFDNAGAGKAANHPVHTVSWYDAVKWCNARSEKEGRTPAYYTGTTLTTPYCTGQLAVQNDWVKWDKGYRLPTEAEWEKAARGGSSGRRFPWADVGTISHSQANYSVNQQSGTNLYTYDKGLTAGYHPAFQTNGSPCTSPVGYFAPNGYGLSDMAGNVWEWCWDWSGAYNSAPQTDPRGPASGSVRVVRGGGWVNDALGCRAAHRAISSPERRGNYMGFRSVLPPGPKN